MDFFYIYIITLIYVTIYIDAFHPGILITHG